MAIVEGRSPTFKTVLRDIKWLYLHSKCGIKTKTHFEWLLWHWSCWSSLGQLNLEPTRPNGLVGCKVPTDRVKISVKEATHISLYYNLSLISHLMENSTLQWLHHQFTITCNGHGIKQGTISIYCCSSNLPKLIMNQLKIITDTNTYMYLCHVCMYGNTWPQWVKPCICKSRVRSWRCGCLVTVPDFVILLTCLIINHNCSVVTCSHLSCLWLPHWKYVVPLWRISNLTELLNFSNWSHILIFRPPNLSWSLSLTGKNWSKSMG